MLYVYAITESPPPPSARGLHGTPLRAVGEGPPFAIVSEHPDLPIEAAEDDLWAHERVVEELMEGGALLPMRLGSTAADDEELLRILRERGAEFQAALERVRGAVELAVRARLRHAAGAGAPVGAASEGPGAGTAYLLERLEGERDAADAVARIHEPLAALARRSARRSRGAGGALNAAYLVDLDRVGAFRERVDELATELEEATIVCTGPWPPYTFSAAEAG
jgi:Gas vesicle synthesis protein GvpL/GvpF